MNNNNVITWQYATNFTENEKRWEEVKTLLIAKISIITKNALLAMTMLDDCEECCKMAHAIESGDRSEYLYEKAKQSIEDAASLEEAGNIFYKAFGKALSNNLK